MFHIDWPHSSEWGPQRKRVWFCAVEGDTPYAIRDMFIHLRRALGNKMIKFLWIGPLGIGSRMRLCKNLAMRVDMVLIVEQNQFKSVRGR